jgi:uncharacterized protein (TIGR02145 family)
MRKYLFSFLFVFWFIVPCNTQTITSTGTDFWIAFPPNQGQGTISISISSSFLTDVVVFSAFPGVNQSFTVIPGIIYQWILPPDIVLLGGIEDKGIRITSTDPISVYGLNYRFYSTDAFLALPVNALGLDYTIMTYTNTVQDHGSCFSVVATQDGTTLTIFNHQTNSTSNINLDIGQTYYVQATNYGEDVTGSRIQSNFPVAVFGSATSVFIPDGCGAADHLVEQMFPYYSWGKNFLTVPLAGRDNSGDIFRVLAAEDGTDISINGTLTTTINTGAYYEVNLTGFNSITTSKATMLAQFAKGSQCSGGNGDPFMMLIPPREQFLTNYTICNVAGFTSHWINITAPDYALGTIYQDGGLIPNNAFTQIGTTNYYGAQRSVTEGSHTFTSIFPFGIFVYGWNDYNSYGYPGGCSLSHVGTVNSVTISPPTVTGILDVSTLCFTAHVADNFSNPVANVLVTFNISGISNITGTGYTDALGNAQYCYARTGSTTGTDNIYAECFGHTSTISTANWILECTNPSTAGTIDNSQVGCGSFIPAPLTSITLPSGQSGNLEYKWQESTISGVTGFSDIAGSNAPGYSPGSISQTTWYRRVARVDCMIDWTGAVMTDALEMTIITPLIPTVTISADPLQLCAGETVTLTATPNNGGTNPAYQWNVNGINEGTNSPVYTYIPINSDLVACVLTSSEICTSNNPASSNQLQMVVNPILSVSVTISASSNPFCPGSSVTFTAIPTNGGFTPSYQWKVNSANTGTDSPNYTYNPANGDLVSCVLTSSVACPITNPVTSNTLLMTINNSLPAGVSITASSNPFCPGSSVTFTATPINGGSAPSYQWKVNGANTGTNSHTFTYNPTDGDSVRCIMTSNLSCVTGNPATSAKIIMSGTLAPIVTFTSCFDTITTINAKPIKLKGGIPLGGTYSGPGVNSLTGIFTPATAGIGTKTITYTYTNAAMCTALAHAHIINYPLSIVNCGNPITDIRDNKVYQTVQIGTQCWLASNLNYGTTIASSQDQRDNCVAEKYCYNDNPTNCTNYGGLYQWDELMLYDETPADQGFCPPGWHIPSENDWNTLFTNYINNAFAGSPLKYSGYSGFNALLSGARYINKAWEFQGFATSFWSSTPRSSTQTWAHGMNEDDPSVSVYPSSRVNALSVRCLKD